MPARPSTPETPRHSNNLVGFIAWTVVGVVAGQVAAVVVGTILTFANIAVILAALLGQNTTEGIFQFLAYLAFAIVFGIGVRDGLDEFRPDAPRGAKDLGATLASIITLLLPMLLSGGALQILFALVPGVFFTLARNAWLGVIALLATNAIVGGLVAAATCVISEAYTTSPSR